MDKQLFKTYMLSFWLVFSISILSAQFTIPEPPKPKFGRTRVSAVYDYASLLQKNQRMALEVKLNRYADTTSTQIVVATIESLKGEDIGVLTPKWAHQWGIGGTAKKDNGVFILLSKKDRKIWISPRYGVEQYLTAGQLGAITRDFIVPEFKKGSYYLGLDKGTSVIMGLLSGTFSLEPSATNDDFPYGVLLFFGILILVIIFSKKKGGNHHNDNDPYKSIILSRRGRRGMNGGFYPRSGGFGSSGGFGGGFEGGFGGGGFSGGGAGGDW